jgi:DNA-binding MarR family transcriptional regulator
MIPAEHADTCRKYVDEARRLGFFEVVDDPNDKRKKRVVPTAEFIDYVRREAQSALEKALAIAKMGSPGLHQSS